MSIAPVQPRRALTAFQQFFANFRPFVAELHAQRTRCNALLQRLEQDQDVRHRRGRVRKLLADRGLHRVFAYEAIRRTTGLRNATPDAIMDLAEQFNAFAPVTDEPFCSREVTKGSGRRIVQDFGPRRRMHQMAVARILRALHPPPGNQTLFRGGMPMARRAIEVAVEDGNTFGVEVDFVAFYASVRPDALPNLLRPLPTSVVDAVVWDRSARGTAIRDQPERCAYPTSSSFEGLSLGSACSPIVGETIIASLLAAAQLRDVVTFADNLFVFGCSEEDVSAKINALRDIVACQLFGELELRVEREVGLGLDRHFEFAKQAGVLRGGGIRWAPGIRKLEQYQVSEAARMVSLAEIAVAEARVVYWRRAYPEWHEGDAHAAEYRAALAVRRYYLDRSPLNYENAIDAIIAAWHRRVDIEPDFPGGLRSFVSEEGDPSLEWYQRLIDGLPRHLQAA